VLITPSPSTACIVHIPYVVDTYIMHVVKRGIKKNLCGPRFAREDRWFVFRGAASPRKKAGQSASLRRKKQLGKMCGVRSRTLYMYITMGGRTVPYGEYMGCR
jgi:hypothetical protein